MNRKWMPVTAGVIEIVHGVAAILGGILFLLVGYTLGSVFGSGMLWYGYVVGAAIIVAGILVLIAGIQALKSKAWPLVLFGAILSFILSLWSVEYWINIERYGVGINTLYGFAWVPAVFTIILTLGSRKQFRK